MQGNQGNRGHILAVGVCTLMKNSKKREKNKTKWYQEEGWHFVVALVIKTVAAPAPKKKKKFCKMILSLSVLSHLGKRSLFFLIKMLDQLSL